MKGGEEILYQSLDVKRGNVLLDVLKDAVKVHRHQRWVAANVGSDRFDLLCRSLSLWRNLKEKNR